jgi:hypothetical protein
MGLRKVREFDAVSLPRVCLFSVSCVEASGKDDGIAVPHHARLC